MHHLKYSQVIPFCVTELQAEFPRRLGLVWSRENMDPGRDRDRTVAGTDFRTCHYPRGWCFVDGRRLWQLGPLLWRNLALVWRRRVLGALASQHTGLWFAVGSKVPGHVLPPKKKYSHSEFLVVNVLGHWLGRVSLWRVSGELGSLKFLPGDFRRAFQDRCGRVQALSRRLDSRGYFRCLMLNIVK